MAQMPQIPEPSGPFARLADLVARLRSARTDWDPKGVPVTPNDQIPPDKGDAKSKPEAEKPKKRKKGQGP